jgi:hypothetical protein
VIRHLLEPLGSELLDEVERHCRGDGWTGKALPPDFAPALVVSCQRAPVADNEICRDFFSHGTLRYFQTCAVAARLPE